MALLESIQGNMSEAGWDIRIAGRIEKPIHGEPLALKRCITNLADNAVHCDESADIIVDDQDRHVVISVSDNGPGIPDDALERVFDPSFRLQASRSQHTGGAGLGLSLVAAVASIHDAKVLLEDIQPGLRVSVTFP